MTTLERMTSSAGRVITLTGSVGFGGSNARNDVTAIQEALSRVPHAQGGPGSALQADGIAGINTKRAIVLFQQHHFHWADGRISPRGPTLQALNHVLSPSTAPRPAVRPLTPAEIRGEGSAPPADPPSVTGAIVITAILGSGECYASIPSASGGTRVRMLAGKTYSIPAGGQVATWQDGTCKIRFRDGTHFTMRPNSLIIAHGDSSARVRAEGAPASVRGGSIDPARLRALSGG